MSFWKKLFGVKDSAKADIAEKELTLPSTTSPRSTDTIVIRCEGCGMTYTLGVDAISMTSKELAAMMPGLIGSIPDSLMIGRTTTSDKEQLQRDRETILRLGPKGWTCKECHKDNQWQPATASAKDIAELLRQRQEYEKKRSEVVVKSAPVEMDRETANAIWDVIWAADLVKVGALLEGNKADLNATIRYGGTPLHWAARKGSKEVAGLLLSKGADVNASDAEGNTPLHWAATWNQKDMAEFLLAKGGDVNSRNNCCKTALHDVRSKDMAVLLIANGGDINAKMNGNCTPLFTNVASNNSAEVLEVLLSKGADVNAKNDTNNTSLHKAVFQCSLSNVTLLLAHKADVNIKNNDGETPLRMARSRELIEIAQLLKKHGGRE